MANKITIKRAAGETASPLPGSAVLSSGELAYSYNNMQASTTGDGDNADVGGLVNNGSGKLFIGGPDDVAPVIVGGAYYTDKVDHFITDVVDGVQQDSKMLSTDASGNLVYNDGNINFDDGVTSLDINHQRALYEGNTTNIRLQDEINTSYVDIKPHLARFQADVTIDGSSATGNTAAALTVLGNQIEAVAGINTPTGVASSLGGLTVLDNQVLNGNLTMTASKAISGVGTINTIDINATGDVDVTGTVTANALDINVSLDVNNIQADVDIVAGNSGNNNIGGVIKSDAGEFDTIEGHQGALTELTGNSSTVTQLRDAIDVTLTGDVHGNVNDITLVGGNTAAGGAGVTITNMNIQQNVVGENEIDMTNVSVIDFKDDEFVLEDITTGQTIGLKNAVLELEDRIQDALGGSGSQGDSSVTTLQSEVNTTQTGAGLAADGTYAPNAAKSYINASTSLRDADEDLSDAVQTLSDRHDTEDALLRAQLTDTSYTDNVVVAKVVDRTISLSGDVAGSVVYNASGNVDIVATIQSQQVEDSMIKNDTITNSKIVNSDFNFSTTDQNATTTTGHVELGTNLPFSGTTNEVTVTTADIGGNDGVVVGLPNDVTITNDLNVGGNTIITGNLNVEGTTTTINTSEVTVEDHVLRIANNAADDAAMHGSGIEIGQAGTHSLLWNDALDTWSTASNDGIQAGNGKVHYGDTVVFTATQGSNVISFNDAVINDANIDGGTWT